MRAFKRVLDMYKVDLEYIKKRIDRIYNYLFVDETVEG